MSILVNDVHSRLNETRVAAIEAPRNRPLAICGSRHSMGGQQFLTDALLVDVRKLDRLLELDLERGIATVEAGCTWPRLLAQYETVQREKIGRVRWGFAQKQTGADEMTIGGAVAANAHGRGLRMKPIVADVVALQLFNTEGQLVHCTRDENGDLFRLVIGGYGLFGIICAVTLRLAPRQVIRRVVRVIDIEDAVVAARRRIEDGFLYGDFQFDIDETSPDFLTKGVFSCYAPIQDEVEIPAQQMHLKPEQWAELLHLAHIDKRRAFQLYAAHYVATDGQLYHSDSHQLTIYLKDYHTQLDARVGATVPGSEMISELYVPHDRLIPFLRAAARRLVALGAPLIYGTIRLIRRDDETFLPWARQDFACVVMNLHVDHSPAGIERAAIAFRALIDEALAFEGSFFLPYHRFATKEQLLRAYPQLPAFLTEKKRIDPRGLFQSDWYRWLQQTLAQ